MHTNKLIFTLLSLIPSLFAMQSGEELFIQKCTSCHSINMPTSDSNLKAPPAVGIMFHLNENFSNDEEIKKHILSFTLHPDKETAICKSVRNFGLMPSQKDNVSKEELELIADWLVDDVYISRRKYKKQKKEMFQN